MNNDFVKKLAEIRQQLPAIIKRLPGIAKVEGLNFIHDNFDKEGFESKPGSIKKWAKRKPIKNDKRTARQLLIDKGKMRRSWDDETTSNDTSAAFTSSMPYTGVHNEGLQAGRPPGFTMPQRQMIGDSDALDKRIEIKLDKMVDAVLK